jgi:hypothetical protein
VKIYTSEDLKWDAHKGVISNHYSYPTLYDLKCFILHLFSFKTPTKWADLSEESDADCALEMRNGVNLQGFKMGQKYLNI